MLLFFRKKKYNINNNASDAIAMNGWDWELKN